MSTTKLVKATLKLKPGLTAKTLKALWDAKTPHFGGIAPHRFDGISQNCAYCNRPKNWS